MTNDTVILDLDGTLFDSTYHLAVAWHRAFEQSGVTVPMWRIHRAIGMGGDRLVPAVAGEEVERSQGDAVRDRWKAAYDELLPDVRPVPGAADLVRHLHGLGLRVAIGSSGKPDHTAHAVGLLGIGDLLDAVTTADDAEESKPAADILQAALDAVGGTSAVVVGDSPYDVEPAHALGFPCVAVRTGGFGRDELVEAGADQVVDAPGELVGLDWKGLARQRHDRSPQ